MAKFQYRIIRSRRLLSGITISLSPTKGVVVKAPFWTPSSMIDSFVTEKSDWIKKHLDKFELQKILLKYEDGEKHLYFGVEYSLSIKISTLTVRNAVSLTDNKIQVTLSNNISRNEQSKKIKEALLYWYLEKGIENITEKVNYFSQKIGVNYTRISLKNVTSIWGSCSSKNCLSFNRKLVMAPHEVVDYVVIHEVSHMVYRNHGQNFWSLVETHDPQYKMHRRWLKKYHHLLSI